MMCDSSSRRFLWRKKLMVSDAEETSERIVRDRACSLTCFQEADLPSLSQGQRKAERLLDSIWKTKIVRIR
jgi:hypothetical protein